MNIEESIIELKGYLTWLEANGFSKLAKDSAIETLLTAYEKEKEENEQWKKYATNDLENQITERNNKIFKIEAELEKEKEKNKKYENMIINHKKQLKQSGIYGYDYDLKILKEE